MAKSAYHWIDSALNSIHRAKWYRSPQALTSPPGAVVELQGQRCINFASNDYLGLAADPRLIQAAIAATQAWGTGATGSRLITGHRDLHRDLECAIADLKQTEDALVFSSGYLANLGVISAVVGARDLILADQYNHASLKQGAILSGATVLDYAHCDLADLKQHLDQHRHQYRRCLMITDSVFSMDGDLCPLPDLCELADTFEAMLLIDEAHATGVLGKTGAGCAEHFGCTGHPLIQIGTLSKALGSLGGYVAGSANLIDFLRNRASTWIYTTGLSPADTAAALAAVQISKTEPQLRSQLWHNVNTLKFRLETQVIPKGGSHWHLLPSSSPILCLRTTSAAAVIQMGQRLRELGCHVGAIRPPTVPTSRLRLTLMATHTEDHLNQLIQALLHAEESVH